MARIHEPGTFVRIPLADGSFAYGRALHPAFDAFYQYRSLEPESDLDKIASSPVLFRISVRHQKSSHWEVIGWRELEERLNQPIIQYTQDKGDASRCTIFDTLGHERVARAEECVGLERWAVWDEHHVEERLLDALMGRPNATVERWNARLLRREPP
jgi:hypothetical protein